FTLGTSGFGSGGACSLQSTVGSDWPASTELFVRQNVFVPEGAMHVRVFIAIDNDVLEVFFNGTRIAGPITHEGCAVRDQVRIRVPRELVREGETNLVAFHLLD